MDVENESNRDEVSQVQRKRASSYSYGMHVLFLASGSSCFGGFAFIAGFSKDAIFGAFLLGAVGGEVVGIVANWIRNNA